MNKDKLMKVAQQLVAKSKGILAADESTGTIQKRFDSIGVECTEENRRDYRSLLFTTEGMEKFISGVILYDETLRQKAADGIAMVKILQDRGVIPGIKVDMGAKDMAMFAGEKITEGLDGLRERLAEYAGLGAGFAKWRAVITIGEGMPTKGCIDANAHALARYAALCQEADIVPIVEPEVLMDGTHTAKQCEEATKLTLISVFEELAKYKVDLEGMLLKPNMIVPAKDCSEQGAVQDVAEATIRIFKETVPSQVPGCVFLSGGLSPDEATERLSAINKMGEMPWELSYSFGRALQSEALTTWSGKKENMAAAQKAFYERAEKVSQARDGK